MQKKLSYILIIGFLLASCGILTSDSQESANYIEFKTLIDSFETETHLQDLETTVLMNRSDADKFLSQFPSNNFTKEQLLNVNFTDSLIVGAFVGSKPNNSYSVNIDSVAVSAKSSLVYITEVGSSFGGRAITWPAHFIVLNKAEFNHRKVDFPYKSICELAPCNFHLN